MEPKGKDEIVLDKAKTKMRVEAEILLAIVESKGKGLRSQGNIYKVTNVVKQMKCKDLRAVNQHDLKFQNVQNKRVKKALNKFVSNKRHHISVISKHLLFCLMSK